MRAGTPTSTERYKKFDELWQGAGGTEHYSLDVNEFDASLMCVLAAVAAKSSDPAAMQAQFRKISGAPGDKYDFTQLAAAMKALAAGQDIDFDGVSGPLDLAANGDPTTSLYDLFDYEKGRWSCCARSTPSSEARGAASGGALVLGAAVPATSGCRGPEAGARGLGRPATGERHRAGADRCRGRPLARRGAAPGRPGHAQRAGRRPPTSRSARSASRSSSACSASSTSPTATC